jgi:hypothetical protein
MTETTPLTDEEFGRVSTVMGGSLAFVAIRCTLQYIVLPFVLPILGIGTTFSVTFSAVLEIFALGMIAYNIYRLWHTDWRWRYMSFSSFIAFIILVFLYLDLRVLLGGAV